LSKAISQRYRRTYFNNPLVEESLKYLPDALQHQTSVAFRAHLVEALPQSSISTRRRFAEYISQRFSHDGRMNLELAAALAKFGDSRAGREILYFEMLRAIPVLHEIASLWLAEQPPEGATRKGLLAFLERRLGGRSAKEVATAAITTFRRCRKISSPRQAVYVPVWAEPPLEAFLYVLARLYPERAMVRVDHLTAQPVLRALLWPRPALVPLLEEARRAGHVSKISRLDQYHQFTLAEPASERMSKLLGYPPLAPSGALVAREPATAYGDSPGDEKAAAPKRRPKAGEASKKRTVAPRGSAKRANEPEQLMLLPGEAR
jgi:hypothetical protein